MNTTAFSDIASDFCEAGQEIISKQLEAKEASDRATKAYNNALIDQGTTRGKSPKEIGEMWETMNAYKDALEADTASLKAEARKLCQDTRNKLQNAVDSFYGADPDKIDQAFVTMADAGFMSATDWAAAFDKYADNGTMLRYIASKVESLEPAKKNAEVTARVRDFNTERTPTAIMGKFDSLEKMFWRFYASDYSPHWGKQYPGMVARF